MCANLAAQLTEKLGGFSFGLRDNFGGVLLIMRLRHVSAAAYGDYWDTFYLGGCQYLKLVRFVGVVECECLVIPVHADSRVNPHDTERKFLSRKGENEFALGYSEYKFASRCGSIVVDHRGFVQLDCADEASTYFLESVYFKGVV